MAETLEGDVLHALVVLYIQMRYLEWKPIIHESRRENCPGSTLKVGEDVFKYFPILDKLKSQVKTLISLCLVGGWWGGQEKEDDIQG